MTADKRSVATDALEVMGKIITDKEVGRDAVHLACFAATSAMMVHPRDHVALESDGTVSIVHPYSKKPKKAVGIVDPFLVDPNVRPGEKFLVLLYPRTIQSLRHVWSHPDVPEEVEDHAVIGRVEDFTRGKPIVEDLIALLDSLDLGREHGCEIDGRDVLSLMTNRDRNDSHFCVYDSDAHGSIKPAGSARRCWPITPCPVTPEAWAMYEEVFGERSVHDPRDLPDGSESPEDGLWFSCSC